MATAAGDLQEAIFKALVEDQVLMAALGAKKMFDQPPANVAFPYISFGQTRVYDWSTGAEKDAEQLFTLHVWSRAKGTDETLHIMERARWGLDDKSLSLDDQNLVDLHLEFAEARYDDDLALHHGLLRFRALMQSG